MKPHCSNSCRFYSFDFISCNLVFNLGEVLNIIKQFLRSTLSYVAWWKVMGSCLFVMLFLFMDIFAKGMLRAS